MTNPVFDVLTTLNANLAEREAGDRLAIDINDRYADYKVTSLDPLLVYEVGHFTRRLNGSFPIQCLAWTPDARVLTVFDRGDFNYGIWTPVSVLNSIAVSAFGREGEFFV